MTVGPDQGYRLDSDLTSGGGAVQDDVVGVTAEAGAFCCALLRQAAHRAGREVRRGHDLVVALLRHAGLFDVEGLSGPAEAARTGTVNLLVWLDRLGLELEAQGCPGRPLDVTGRPLLRATTSVS